MKVTQRERKVGGGGTAFTTVPAIAASIALMAWRAGGGNPPNGRPAFTQSGQAD